MAYSIQTAVSDGTLEVLDLSIKYMDKSHIFVYVDDVLVDGSAYSYVWLTDTRIQVVPAVANGSTIKVIRKTLTDEMWHEFSKGARFSTTSMDENFEQLLFLAQEYSEGIYVSDFYTDVDIHLKRILNLGDPINDGDAVNLKTLKEYLPNADLIPPLVERIAVEEAKSVALNKQGITLGNLTITGFDATGLQNNAWVHFAGRDTVGDGGGGPLRFLLGSTAPADGGTVYEVTGGRLVREGWSVFGVDIRWYGFKADWDGTNGTNNASKFLQVINNLNVNKITGAPGKYWFGNIIGDTALATVSRPLTIDWNGAELFIGETNPTAANTSSAFIKVLNSGGFVMRGYEFTDTTFSYSNNSRGIQPVSIVNSGNNITHGYEVGDFYVRKGQSTLTAFSENPGQAIAKGIRFTGNCRGGQVYYGVNLAYSGDDCKGRITMDNVHRLAFVYDIDDIDLELHAYNTEPSSANLLIAGNGTRKTQNVNIRAILDVVNGGVLISGLNTTPNPASFENINLDVFAKSAGVNAGTSGALVRIGVQDVNGNWVDTNNYSLSNVHVKARSLFKYSFGMVGVMTRGNNVGRISVDAESFSPLGDAGDYRNTTMCFKLPGNRTIVSNSGNLQTTPVKLNLLKLIPTGPKNIFGTLRVTSVVSDTNMTIKEYRIAGFLSSDGTHNLSGSGVSLVNSFQIGTYNPTITVSTDFITYNIGASAGGDANAYTIIEFTFADGTA